MIMHDHTIIGWKVWYTKDRFYSSRETKWKDLPEDGFLVGMVYEAQTSPQGHNYRIFYKAMDYYWSDSDIGLNLFKSNDYPSVPTSLVKHGIWVSDEEYQATIDKTDEPEYLMF
ncbi:hypothetical protein LCGC14_1286050 [marine sediment metagenome]|uniref:Uncharacterized protein n=1 Tax=marine sediment metagenome TaxID=412755 RepID=A0A0F9KVF6_9ZZZZ